MIFCSDVFIFNLLYIFYLNSNHDLIAPCVTVIEYVVPLGTINVVGKPATKDPVEDIVCPHTITFTVCP